MARSSGTSSTPEADRRAKARAKMQRQLRKRGHREPTAHLSDHALIELIQQTLSEEVHYNKRMVGAYRTARPQWVEVSEDYFAHCLNALPPIELRQLGHIMGSAFGHNGSGESVWFCFLQVKDRHGQPHFLGKICTRMEWRQTYISATYETLVGIQPRSTSPF